MARLELNPLLNLILAIIEAIVLIGFLFLYIKQKNIVLKPLIWSVGLFLVSNVLSFIFFVTYSSTTYGMMLIIILAHLMIGGALIMLVTYLEMFENDEPFTKRSSIAIMLILVTGILQMISNFLGEPFTYLGLLTPIPYVITGMLYMKYVYKIRVRANIRSQRKKIGKVRTGIFMIFISPVVIYATLGVLLIVGLIFTPVDYAVDVSREADTFNLGSMDPIVMLSQLIGVLMISIPVLRSKSAYFMQSRKLSRIIVIEESGLPIYDFNFEPKNESSEMLLSGALTAIKSVMKEATGASKELRSIAFADLHIITEVREGFAVNLIVEGSTAYLKEALRLFAMIFN
ncbi:MAG: hypothetical protein ACTSSK_00925 [Candidatus Heimdallarchaeota archaeon]